MESERGEFNERGYIAYRGKLTLDELMMDDPAETEPIRQTRSRKRGARPRGAER